MVGKQAADARDVRDPCQSWRENVCSFFMSALNKNVLVLYIFVLVNSHSGIVILPLEVRLLSPPQVRSLGLKFVFF